MEAIVVRDLHKEFLLVHNNPGTLKRMITTLQPPKFEKLEVLKGISFTVETGETLAIVGRNGSGKSTLLGILARVYKPNSGTVEVRGRVAPLLELGAGFHPDLSGIENIYLNGSILGLKRQEIDKRLDAIIEFSELGSFIDAAVRTYSSGMAMRLGFSVAVHTDPDVLLVDEVLSVGDAAFKEKCEAKIREFQQNGKTIVFISHESSAVEQIATRAIWLDHGVIRAEGDVRGVIAEYGAAMGVHLSGCHEAHR